MFYHISWGSELKRYKKEYFSHRSTQARQKIRVMADCSRKDLQDKLRQENLLRMVR